MTHPKWRYLPFPHIHINSLTRKVRATMAEPVVEPLDGDELATPGAAKVRGVKGLPKGVSVVKGRYQGRVSHKPTSTVQRSVGLYGPLLDQRGSG